jgi:hypothetical protein
MAGTGVAIDDESEAKSEPGFMLVPYRPLADPLG